MKIFIGSAVQAFSAVKLPTTLIKRGHRKERCSSASSGGSSHSEGNGTRFRRYQQEDG